MRPVRPKDSQRYLYEITPQKVQILRAVALERSQAGDCTDGPKSRAKETIFVIAKLLRQNVQRN